MNQSSLSAAKALCLVLLLALSTRAQNNPKITHRFLATDESGGQVLLVDETEPQAGWAVKLKARDLQLVGANRLMVSVNTGYRELAVADGRIVRTGNAPGFKRVTTARRQADGSTVLGGYGDKGIEILFLDAEDAPAKRLICPPEIKNIRLMRLTTAHTILLGSGPVVYELDGEGNVVWKQTVEGGNHIYKAVRMPDGDTYIASGYGAFLVRVAPDGKQLSTWGALAGQKVTHPKFFADFQVLANGNVVICNWMGHKREDSMKGQQLCEYSPSGELVWTWHNPELAGCLHGVIVLDELDTERLHTEVNGVLRPVPDKAPAD